jgi:hypothetical protein
MTRRVERMVFKIVINGESSGLCMNGADLYEILSLEVQEMIDNCGADVKSCFDPYQAVYLSAGKPVHVKEGGATEVMESVLGATFSE